MVRSGENEVKFSDILEYWFPRARQHALARACVKQYSSIAVMCLFRLAFLTNRKQ